MIMRKIIPRFTGGAVVFTDRTPGAFAHIRSPASPRCGVVWRFFKPDFFCGHAWHREFLGESFQTKS